MKFLEKLYVKSKYCDFVIELDWLGDLIKKIVLLGLKVFFYFKC